MPLAAVHRWPTKNVNPPITSVNPGPTTSGSSDRAGRYSSLRHEGCSTPLLRKIRRCPDSAVSPIACLKLPGNREKRVQQPLDRPLSFRDDLQSPLWNRTV